MVLALMAVAYVGGVVTGVVGKRQAAPRAHAASSTRRPTASPSKAARPVDRKALERAAVEGMLKVLGDRWSTYYGASEYASFQDALDGHYSGVGLWLADATGRRRSRSAASCPARRPPAPACAPATSSSRSRRVPVARRRRDPGRGIAPRPRGHAGCSVVVRRGARHRGPAADPRRRRHRRRRRRAPARRHHAGAGARLHARRGPRGARRRSRLRVTGAPAASCSICATTRVGC